MKLNLLTCVGLDYDFDYITHFCKHYEQYVDEWFVILQTNDKRYDLIEDAKRIFNLYGKCNFYIWDGEWTGPRKVDRYFEINKSIKSDENYILFAEIDEFHEYLENPRDILKEKEYVFGEFVDRFSSKIKNIEEDKSIFEQFPIERQYTKTLGAGVFKPCLFHSKFILTTSHHLSIDGNRYGWDNLNNDNVLPNDNTKTDEIKIHNFKWTYNTRDKLINRVKVFKKYDLKHWKESAQALREIYGYEI